MGSKGPTLYFCETSHVAYQIKSNRAQSTMKGNMLSLHTQTTPGGSKGHIFFSKSGHLAYQIKKGRSVDLHARYDFEFTHSLVLLCCVERSDIEIV